MADEEFIVRVFGAIGGPKAERHIQNSIDILKTNSPLGALVPASVEDIKALASTLTHLAAKVGIGTESEGPTALPATPAAGECKSREK